MTELVSIVIPTTDKELPTVQKCVWCLEQSTYKNIEIILVNEGKERSDQRNIGLDRAKGEYILILDSDQYVSSRLIAECVGLMRGGFSAVYIPEIITTPGWFGRLRNWERQFYTGTAVDVVRFVRATECVRFNPDLKGPEDSDFDRRVKGIRAVSRNVVYHDDSVTVLSYFRKKAYYSKSMRFFYERWPKDKVLNFWYRCFIIFLEEGKWKRFLARPLSATMVMAMIVIRGIIYLSAKKS